MRGLKWSDDPSETTKKVNELKKLFRKTFEFAEEDVEVYTDLTKIQMIEKFD